VKKIKCLPITVGFFHVNLMVLWSFRNTRNQQFFESEFFKYPNSTVLQFPKVSHGTQVRWFFDSEFFSKNQNQWVLQKSDTRPKWVVTGSERGNPILEIFLPLNLSLCNCRLQNEPLCYFQWRCCSREQGVYHICVALPCTLKISILRQKKNYENSNISRCKIIIFQKYPHIETKILQEIITL
jgi:hypothetical protein